MTDAFLTIGGILIGAAIGVAGTLYYFRRSFRDVL